MRKPTKIELIFSITLLITGLYLMFTEYKEWSSPIIFGVLTFQQMKNFLFFRKNKVQESNKKAKTSLYSALIIGSSTVLMIVLNLYSLLAKS
jgi:hypothetical protein